MLRDPRNYPYTFYLEGESVIPSLNIKSPDGTWGIRYGIHDGTLMSRDVPKMRWGLSSFSDCLNLVRESIAIDSRHYFWFAQALAPDGTVHKIIDGAFCEHNAS